MKSPPRSYSALLLLLLVLSCARAASAEPSETIVNNGPPQNRVDIAVMGDGYTAAEMDKYHADVERFIRLMFEQEPYGEYRRYFNVHRIDVVSAQSGADHPEPGRNSFVNTALNAAYNCGNLQRLICADLNLVNGVLGRSLTAAQQDIKLVIVNDEEYGGSGGPFAVASTHEQAVEIILHELGHSFGLLGDEYDGSNCPPAPEPTWANLTRTTDRNSIKWLHWIDPATPIPTFAPQNGVPGLYEGGAICNNGYYRPTFNSKMRTLFRPFEQVNTEQLVRRVYSLVSPLDAASPEGGPVTLTQGQTQDFSVSTPSPATRALTVTWFVDGEPKAVAPAFTLDTAALGAGAHTVEVLVRDGTEWVRADPEQLLAEARRWDVTVSAAATPTPTPSPVPSPTPYPPGESPVLLTEEGTQKAVALETVNWLSGPFTLFTTQNFSADRRTRISLFVFNAELLEGESPTAFTAQAEDGARQVFPLTVEHAAKVRGVERVTQLVVRLPEGLAGEVRVSVSLRGTPSNKASVFIQ
jgi:hypothetical protein